MEVDLATTKQNDLSSMRQYHLLADEALKASFTPPAISGSYWSLDRPRKYYVRGLYVFAFWAAFVAALIILLEQTVRVSDVSTDWSWAYTTLPGLALTLFAHVVMRTVRLLPLCR
ncbi:hypothetical protein BDZ85DRAFT_283710 [Elsinoe ampelina]|uniref:Uncharacterized protein n=1 Tax=Elsinoe ampelina TaxID=302913 RepID=A0A6A6G7V4_9PEZI|nr:hypothetical protein BDZ85DRAFT_283710 [Elsinoe ampelina]